MKYSHSISVTLLLLHTVWEYFMFKMVCSVIIIAHIDVAVYSLLHPKEFSFQCSYNHPFISVFFRV